jgi:hypothetical protein
MSGTLLNTGDACHASFTSESTGLLQDRSYCHGSNAMPTDTRPMRVLGVSKYLLRINVSAASSPSILTDAAGLDPSTINGTLAR